MGLKPIEDVRVGELVAARNVDTGGIRWQPVLSRSMRLAPQVMRLTVRDEAGRVETIVVTENHPYLRADGTVDLLRAVALEPRGAFDELQQSRWTGAGFLKAGDTLQSALTRSAPGTLTVVSSEVVLAPTPVYNFEVAGDHTYAVGQLAAWVHNAIGRVPPGKLRREWEKNNKQPWPKTADGRNYDACHIRALADGGDNSPDNIRPMTREDHIADHKAKGDYKRWGGRRKCGC